MWGKRKTKQKVVEFGFCLFMEMGKETNAFEFEFLIFLQYTMNILNLCVVYAYYNTMYTYY